MSFKGFGFAPRAAGSSAFDDDDNEDDYEQTKAESSDEDSLDAFMAGIENQVKTQKSGQGPKVIREDFEKEDDHEAVYQIIQKKKLEEAENLKNMEAEMEYDSDDNPIIKVKEFAPLDPVNHDEIDYPPFRKNFYEEHQDIKKLTPAMIHTIKQERQMKVSGFNCPTPVCSFGHFKFDEVLLKQIRKMNFTMPSAIQAQAVPAGLLGRDIIGIAKTGSGKTCAFLWPMLIHINDQPELEKGDGPIGLICAPTRELAQQIFTEAKRFGHCFNFKIAAVYGGDSKYEQSKALKEGAEIVVATPGRLIDMVKGKHGMKLNRVTYLVLDEADRMFDLGFEPQVKSIVNNTRPDRQTMLFSATFKSKVEKLARLCLTDPVRIVIGDVGEANQDVTQFAQVFADENMKWPWLMDRIVSFLSEGSVLIFVNKKANCDELAENLKKNNFEVGCLHGDMNQMDRNNVVVQFKKNVTKILVATDVAARGLDIPLIKVVINFDVASSIDTHTHRIGRTGRAGTKGTAHTLITEKQTEFAGQLVRNLEQANQVVPEKLLAVAKKSDKFRKSRDRHRGIGSGGRGRGRGRGRVPVLGGGKKYGGSGNNDIGSVANSRASTYKKQMNMHFRSNFTSSTDTLHSVVEPPPPPQPTSRDRDRDRDRPRDKDRDRDRDRGERKKRSRWDS